LIPVPTLEWIGGCLRLLDQRLLPFREVYIECRRVDTLAEAIRTLAVRGAPAIGLAAAYGAVLAAMEAPPGPGFRGACLKGFDQLSSTRPTAVNLFHCLDVQRRVLFDSDDRDGAVAALLESALRLHRQDLDASAAMGGHGAALVPPNAGILTHCNAGGLATGGLGTALAVIYRARERGLVREVFADETRPLLQGARLTAWELVRAGIPVTVLPDSAAASLLASGRVDLVVTGADRIARNGDTANKVGTFPLALAARRAGVPFYVAAPRSTFDPDTEKGSDIVIENRDPGEVARFGDAEALAPGAGAWNPAFDVTPAELIDLFICETGVFRSPGDIPTPKVDRGP
jgi:methylthioribose-1-phosphate isomerase